MNVNLLYKDSNHYQLLLKRNTLNEEYLKKDSNEKEELIDEYIKKNFK